jgi:hypothetical protein
MSFLTSNITGALNIIKQLQRSRAHASPACHISIIFIKRQLNRLWPSIQTYIRINIKRFF